MVALLGLVGTPPTAVFIGKVTTAAAAWDGQYAWLAVVVFVNTVISLFYYLRWIVPTVRAKPDPADTSGDGGVAQPWAARIAVLAAAASLLLGVAAGPVWQLLS